MKFRLNEEQQILSDTLNRLLEKHYDFDTRKKLAATERGYSERNWRTFGDLGLLGINIAEEFGGLSGNAVDALIVMEAMGRHLVVEPFLSTAIVSANIITSGGSQAMKEFVLPKMVNGDYKMAIATLEPQARFDLWDIKTHVAKDGEAHLLTGSKAVVLNGDTADGLIVSARGSESLHSGQGVTLYLVDPRTPGVTIRGFPNIDGTRSAEITLTNVKVNADAIIGTERQGYPILENAFDRGLAALASEAVGAMSRLYELTVEFLKNRKQFGQPLAHFQVLQHRMADMLIAIEQARAITLYATSKLDEPDVAIRRKAASAAKAVIGRSARYVGQQAVQLHGGMGMTDELSVGYYFKRLTCIDMTWGNTDHHTDLYGNAL
jgi:alkylation response protein AidB-like acyl-CoA dehydrogenase